MDTLTPSQRSERMARVRSKDTKPELLVRRVLNELGARYRLHVDNLPGKPDIVLRSRRIVIFVHGCFWHRHQAKRCRLARLPNTRKDYWLPKLARNVTRDRRNRRALRAMGWKCVTLWECQLARPERVLAMLSRLLGSLNSRRS